MARQAINKQQRRRELTIQAHIYLLDVGIESFSIQGLLKHLKMGKSSFYHYFTSKEEIIYEIFNVLTEEYVLRNFEYLYKEQTLKQKLEIIYEPYLIKNEYNLKKLEIAKEYISMGKKNKTERMSSYNRAYMNYIQKLLSKIIQEEIEKGNTKKEALNYVSSLIATISGMIMHSFMLDDYDLSKELDNYFNLFCELLLIKKESD